MRSIFFSLVILSSNLLSAHQVDISSTMLAETENGSWVLQVRAAMTAFEYEVEQTYPSLTYESPEAFNDLVLKLVHEQLKLSINSTEVELTNGMVKLGHETNVVFPIEGFNGDIEQLSIAQKMFKDINKNRSALVLMKKGSKAQQFILDKSNNHMATIVVEDGLFVNTNISLANSGSESVSMWKMVLGGGLLLGVVFFGIGRRKKK